MSPSNLTSTELKRLHREWRRRASARLSIGLDGVQGPFNVGAIIRSAAAYQAEHLWLTETATGPDNAKVDKTALGTARYLRTARVVDAGALADAARTSGYRVVGVELAAGAVPMHELGDHQYFAYVTVENIDAFHAGLLRNETALRDRPTDKPWGMREFGLTTPDGHRIVFGEEL